MSITYQLIVTRTLSIFYTANGYAIKELKPITVIVYNKKHRRHL